MLTLNHFKTLGLAAVATLAMAPAANAFTLHGPLTAQEFEDRNVEEAMSPESRWGEGGLTAATHEVNIHNGENTATFDESNFLWENGTAVDFSVVFDGINTLTYTVGDTVLETTSVERDFSDLYLRTTARLNGSSIVLQNLTFDNGGASESVSDVSSVCTSPTNCGFFDASYFHIGDIDGAFELTGQSIMSWDEASNPPKNSRLAYQVKLVYDEETVDVPEPGMMLGLAGLAVGAIARRKKDEAPTA
ncbi:MAG: PEP-CTERM sorting domain-containing protein [Cyanobacteria bacterium P01_H01_bin.130]